MPKPTLLQRTSWKTYLRKYKDDFPSQLQEIPFFYIDEIFTQISSGISTTTPVKVIIFDNFEEVDVTSAVNNNELIYIPALYGDTISLGIGSSSYTFEFIGEDQGIIYNNTTYGFGASIPIGNKNLIIKGLGGALLQPADPPVYSLTQSGTTVNEGGSINFVINTFNVGSGATLYYSTGGSMEAADFSDNSLTGSFSIVSTGATTGVATVTRTIANDINTESTESFTFVVRTGSTSGPVVATSDSVNVIDVVPTYSVVPSTTSLNEGSSVTFTVTTTGVPNATILYWTILPIAGTISASDFTDAATNGSFTVNSNSGTITRTLAGDRSTEGLEAFQIQIRRSSITGTVIATSETVYINDTSLNVGQSANGLTFGPVQVNRDNGNSSLASDWYTICGIDNLPDGSSIALFIDTSGSMTQATIQASYNLLVQKLNEKNITITSVTNPNEDWITPFLVDLP